MLITSVQDTLYRQYKVLVALVQDTLYRQYKVLVVPVQGTCSASTRCFVLMFMIKVAELTNKQTNKTQGISLPSLLGEGLGVRARDNKLTC